LHTAVAAVAFAAYLGGRPRIARQPVPILADFAGEVGG
jgi:hypothetical protein